MNGFEMTDINRTRIRTHLLEKTAKTTIIPEKNEFQLKTSTEVVSLMNQPSLK